ncbi:MAG: hypothetical protein M3315_12605 [Actinomycetota bacterium]|nr:hypothetical protein [Actinomycetota bacterium]
MTQRASILFKIGWISLAIIGVAILVFGLIATMVPASSDPLYPVFWTAHLLGGLPPGKEHVHQLVFIVLSLAGLLLPVREFFPRRSPPY